jgi:hypothetical protein
VPPLLRSGRKSLIVTPNAKLGVSEALADMLADSKESSNYRTDFGSTAADKPLHHYSPNISLATAVPHCPSVFFQMEIQPGEKWERWQGISICSAASGRGF